MEKKDNLMQGTVSMIESFLCEHYEFRRNVLSGKTEFRKKAEGEDNEQLGRISTWLRSSVTCVKGCEGS